MIAIDSNVLIFLIQKSHPWHQESIRALRSLLAAGEAASVFLQNIAEFWNVCTRPINKNGLGLSTMQTELHLATLEVSVTVLADPPGLYGGWHRLVALHEVKGVQVHDARLAACIRGHGIERILTYNPTDFKRYGITVLHPRDVGIG